MFLTKTTKHVLYFVIKFMQNGFVVSLHFDFFWGGVPLLRGGTNGLYLHKTCCLSILPVFVVIVNRYRQRHMPKLDDISQPNFRSWQVPDVTKYLSEWDLCS
jgi:hypothetical protein